MSADTHTSSHALSLHWLRRLRWFAIVGQGLGLVLASLFFEISLPWGPLCTVLGLAMLSNIWLHWSKPATPMPTPSFLALIIGFDVLALTALLYWTGGHHNPFTSFYLVHLSLAAMALSAGWLWTLVAASAFGYGMLFAFYQPLIVGGEPIESGCPSYSWHLQGMAVAFVITAAFVAVFVARMHRVLQERDIALAEARLTAARNDQFAALATLAAGVAHELGSPLGTIAVASRELVRNLEAGGLDSSAAEDAKLIREEVERCRGILDRLSQKATGGVGDAPENFGTEALFVEVRGQLPSVCQTRFRLVPGTADVSLFLPRVPIVQALGILVKNACDADRSGQPIELCVKALGGCVELSVRDHGPGLDPKLRVHAGEPFFTTKPPGQGMGLGLFLVRTLAFRLGGELTLLSPSEGGFQATLKLPVVSL